MTKRGRPKKQGERYKCGKLTHEDVTEVAVMGKLRSLGLSPERHYPSFEDLRNNNKGRTGKELAQKGVFGSPLSRLQHWGYIKSNQAIAGHEFAQTMREYLATAKLQKPSQNKAGFVQAMPDNSDGPAVRGESRAKAYMNALAEVDRTDPFSSPTATATVWKVCVNEEDIVGDAAIGALRVGLNSIERVINGKKAA